MTTMTEHAAGAAEPLPAAAMTGLRARLDLRGICTLGAALLLIVAYFLPLWHLKLLAPQYPNDLHLVAYGTTMTGDLQEINSLNHYAGVKEIKPDEVLELKLFPFLLFGFVAAVLASFWFRKRLIRLAVLAVAWAFPVGFLVDIQYWLYNYGHNLKPEAPLYPGPFTPKAIGRTQVVNFHSETMVSWGWWFMVAAAILLTFGPPLIRFLVDSWNNTGASATKTAAVSGVLALAAASIALGPGTSPARAAEPGDLNAMIAAAEPGSTLTVPAGPYEGPVVIDKSLTLEGVGWPVIDGHGVGDVVRITAEDVTLRGFVIQGSGREVSDEPSGVRVNADRAVIEGNRLHDVLYGVFLFSSDGHVVRGNSIQSYGDFPAERRGHALYLYDTYDNHLVDNDISFAKDGIYINFSARNLVEGNDVRDLRYGIHFMYADDSRVVNNVFTDNLTGASIMYSKELYLEGNEFSYSRSGASGYGILFKDVNDVDLVGNFIHHNHLGLTLEGTPLSPQAHARFEENFIGYNQLAIQMSTTTNSLFVGNSFIGNLQQVETTGGSVADHNSWSRDGRGNYWDIYEGYDASGDGVGDVPFRYEGLYEDLAADNESLSAYKFTFAQAALDLTSRWFPVYRPDPRVIDNNPLMSPEVTLPRDTGSGATLAALAMALGLAVIPAAGFWFARSSFQRGWNRCST